MPCTKKNRISKFSERIKNSSEHVHDHFLYLDMSVCTSVQWRGLVTWFIFVFFRSSFENNTSLEDNEDTSAVAAFRFPTIFLGHNYFIRNRGGGITLLNTRMQANGTVVFDSNVAVFGGGIAMDDRCLVSHCLYLSCFSISPGSTHTHTHTHKHTHRVSFRIWGKWVWNNIM